MIWLGAYFYAQTLGYTFCPLTGLCISFWVHLGVPKWPVSVQEVWPNV
jgi:hypothetical protein